MIRFNKYFCIFLILLLPITTYAKLTGEIIIRHPSRNFGELWVTTIENPRQARWIAQQNDEIEGLSVQKDGDLIATLMSDQPFKTDVFVIKKGERKGRNLTNSKYEIINDLSVSVKGDIVFTNIFDAPQEIIGIYLISNSESKKEPPIIKMIKKVDAFSVDFSPDGKLVAYDNRDGIFTVDIRTGRINKIMETGYRPHFAPNTKKLAYVDMVGWIATHINIISLNNPNHKTRIELVEHKRFINIQWSPDGQYITYTVEDHEGHYHIYAAPIDGGKQEEVLDVFDGWYVIFDWTETTLSVDPSDKITTTWGHLKIDLNVK